jgi:hypothetical protein
MMHASSGRWPHKRIGRFPDKFRRKGARPSRPFHLGNRIYALLATCALQRKAGKLARGVRRDTFSGAV